MVVLYVLNILAGLVAASFNFLLFRKRRLMYDAWIATLCVLVSIAYVHVLITGVSPSMRILQNAITLVALATYIGRYWIEDVF